MLSVPTVTSKMRGSDKEPSVSQAASSSYTDSEDEEEDKNNFCACCTTKCCCRATTFVLSSFGMTVFVLLYLLMGAFIFKAVEQPEELRILKKERADYLKLRGEYIDKVSDYWDVSCFELYYK